MIVDSFDYIACYKGLHPNLDKAIDWLNSHTLDALENGKTIIDGENVFVNVMDADLRDADGAAFEYHRRYADLQIDLTGQVAAVSCGIVGGQPLLDLDYPEDSHADVDLNLVGTADGGIVEIQGTGERSTLSRAQLNDLLDIAEPAIARLCALQDEVTGFSA